jgi:hypothetical protein
MTYLSTNQIAHAEIVRSNTLLTEAPNLNAVYSLT